MNDKDIDWEKHGEYVSNTPGTNDGVNRWVCNHCGKDFPLDLSTDIFPHLQEDHEDVFDAIDDQIAKGERLDD